jgi:membrane-bound lytic murein transglycosylase F
MRIYTAFIASIIALVVVLNACSPQRTILEQVIALGELHVLTRNAGTSYYEGPQGPAGLEYQLAKRFAEYLGVELKITVPDSLSDIIESVSKGDAHLAAAGLTITQNREQEVRFSPSYQTITQQVVYHRNRSKPATINEIDGVLEVMAQSSHVEQLRELSKQQGPIEWIENPEADSSELLSLVAQEVVDYTIADSNEVTFNRRYHPELKVAFNLTEPQPIAWAFPKGEDNSLYDAAAEFLQELKKSGELERLIKNNYQHVRNYDYAGTHSYLAQIRRRLPNYKEYFQLAAEKYDLDWRLLAALSYQESHWRPDAVSPTGVRGMMMLTNATADDLGVVDRIDPEQSIFGGARYLRDLIDKVPDHISDPDRTWIAVAAYNVGYGHVNDARKIVRKLGDDPDSWVDIKAALPLLAKHKWYKQTKHGYARGWEPVRYVENIRSYYDILVWHLEREKPKRQQLRPILAFSSSAI